VQSLGQAYNAYQLGIGPPDVLFDYGSTKFVAPEVSGKNITVLTQDLPITDNGGRGAAFIVYPHNAHYFPLIESFHPGGEREEAAGPNGAAMFFSYRLSAPDIDAGRGVEATYRDAEGRIGSRRETNFGGSTDGGAGDGWSPPPGLRYPVRVTWRATLSAPQYGIYAFAASGAALELAIDGRVLIGKPGVAAGGTQVPSTVEVVLARGLHEIELGAQLATPASSVGLKWTPPHEAAAPVPSALLSQSPSGGLAGEIWTGVADASLASFAGLQEVAPTLRQSDSFIGFHALDVLIGDQPLVARWRGRIVVPAEGEVTFEIRSSGPAQLIVDGVALEPCPAGGSIRNEVTLTAGAHDVELDYARTGGRARLELWWVPPGEEQLVLVPPTALEPGDRVWLRGEIPDPPRSDRPAADLSAPLRAAQTLGVRSRLSEPRGVAVDARGRVFVGDTGNRRVVKMENGKVAASWDGRSSQPALGEFGVLSDLAVAADGRVAVVDQENGDVTLFDADGKVERHLPHHTTSASGIDLDHAGSIWLADTGASRILRIGPDGAVSAIWTGEGAGFERLEQPTDVVVDAQGVVYAVDLRGRIVRFAADGRIDAQWNVEIGLLRGGSHLAAGGGRVLMTQPDRGLLVVLDTTTGGVRHHDLETRLPLGIDVGADGRTYVVDSSANRVHIYDQLE
jgi:sugar lactone lactonase YvrE